VDLDFRDLEQAGVKVVVAAGAAGAAMRPALEVIASAPIAAKGRPIN
jgi:hypothetical protein